MLQILSRLRWHNPFDRTASVLHAIEEANLPLRPPDDDVELSSSPKEFVPQRDPDSQYSMAFLSHTTTDEPLIQARILPTLQPFFGQIFLMNIGMVLKRPSSGEIVHAYKRKIVRALSMSPWFIVVASASAASSKWVGFEFSWALRNRSHHRILALTLDRAGKKAFSPVLPFVSVVPAYETSIVTEAAIARALRHSGAEPKQ